MNDFELAAKKIGNRFDLVLIASERMREIHRSRRAQEDLGERSQLQANRNKSIPPAHQAISDIESGKVGKEYLIKIKDKAKAKPRRPKFEDVI